MGDAPARAPDGIKKKARKRRAPEAGVDPPETAVKPRPVKLRRTSESGDACESAAPSSTANLASTAVDSASAELSKKAKKKLREKRAKERRREQEDKKGKAKLADSPRHAEKATLNGSDEPAMTKRMKKRQQYKAKLAAKKGEAENVTSPSASDRGATKGKGKGKGDKASEAKVRSAQVGKATPVSRRRAGSDEDSDDPYRRMDDPVADSDAEEEVYLGRRARKTAGKGGQVGKGRKGGTGPVHLSKKERRAKKAEKDSQNADKQKSKGRGKGGKKKGKGKGKGKGRKKKGR